MPTIHFIELHFNQLVNKFISSSVISLPENSDFAFPFPNFPFPNFLIDEMNFMAL